MAAAGAQAPPRASEAYQSYYEADLDLGAGALRPQMGCACLILIPWRRHGSRHGRPSYWEGMTRLDKQRAFASFETFIIPL